MLVPRTPRGTPQVAEAETTAASDDHPQDEAEDEQEGTQAGREEEKVRRRPAFEPVLSESQWLAARVRPGSGRVQAARGSQGGGPLGASRQLARRR